MLQKQGFRMSEKAVTSFMDKETRGSYSYGQAWEPRMPAHPRDIETGAIQQAAPGLGDWDYQDANGGNRLGPEGQELPQGAQAWDAFGRPYYGDGVTGWFNEVKSRFLRPVDDKQTNANQMLAFNNAIKRMQDGLRGGDDGEATPEENRAAVGGAFQAVGALAGILGSALTDAGGEEGDQPNALGYTARVVEEGVRAVLTGFDQIGKLGKRVVGTGAFTVRDIALAQGVNIPGIDIEAAEDRLSQLGATSSAGDGLFAPQNGDGFWGVVAENWQASRMAGTAFFDEAARVEMIRRVRAGENPELVAREIQNPLAELGAELVLDPLNYIGGLFARVGTGALRTSLQVSDATKIYGATPEATKIIEGLQAADKVNDAQNVAEAQRLRDIIMDTTARVQNKINKGNRSLGLTLNAEGRAAQASSRLNHLVNGLVKMSKDPDVALDTFRHLMLMASDNVDEVSEGMAILSKHSNPRILVSQAGSELGLLLRNMWGKTDDVIDINKTPKWFGEFKKIDNVPDQIAFMEKKVHNALGDVYPSVARQLKNGEDVHWAVKAVHNTHQKLQKGFGPLNQGLSTVFMSHSGFGIRNGVADTSVIWAAEGFGSHLWTTPQKATEFLTGVFDVVPSGAQKAFGGAIGGVAESKIGQNLAENIESWSALRTFVPAVKRTLRNVLKPGSAIAPIEPLLDAGFSPGEANMIVKQLQRAWGNVDTVRENLEIAQKTGILERARVLDFVADADIKVLDNLVMNGSGGFDEMVRIANEIIDEGGSADDVIARWESDVFNFAREEAQKFAKQHVGGLADETSPTFRAQAALAESGSVSERSMAITADRFEANKGAIESYRHAAQDALDSTKATLQDMLSRTTDEKEAAVLQEAQKQLQAMEKAYEPYLTGAINDEVVRVTDSLYEQARGWSKGLGEGSTITRRRRLVEDMGGVEKAWKRFGLPGEAPEGLSVKGLYDTLWDDYVRPRMTDQWNLSRDLHKMQGDEFLEQLSEVGKTFGHKLQSNLVDKAQGSWEQAVKLQDALILPDGGMVIDPKGSHRALMQLINRYDIPLGKVDGAHFVPSKRALNTINKYLPEGAEPFARLEDVPFEQGQQALELWAKEKGKGVVPIVFKNQIDEAGEIAAKTGDEAAQIGDDVGRKGIAVDVGHIDEVDALKSAGYSEEVASAFHANNRIKEDVKRIKAAAKRAGEDPYSIVGGPGVRLAELEKNSQAAGRKLSALLKKEGASRDDLRKVLGQDKESVMRRAGEEAAALADELEVVYPPLVDDGVLTPQKGAYAQIDEYEKVFERVSEQYRQTFGQVQEMSAGDRNKIGALDEFLNTTATRMEEAKIIASRVGEQSRDFVLHDYRQKGNINAALGYLMPYHFWHQQHYKKALLHVANSPGVVTSYANYRDFMEKIHADLPEWMKYSMNTNEMFGMDSENPMFFNLESIVNPMYGLTGSNFEDPQKRVNWWTKSLDDASKFGPSTHPLWGILTAVAMQAQGEEEAAARWGGTGLLPQARVVKAATNMMGIGPAGGVQLDPFVWMFSGGVDPYERRRVGRALYSLVEQDPSRQEEAIDAARTQSGEMWDEAMTLQANQRGWGQISSFFLGVGFQHRSLADQEIDQFDRDWRTLFAMRDNLSPDEWQQAMTGLEDRYPFKDVVLISRKGDETRDAAYAYNVLGRLPPGTAYDVADLAGIPRDLVSQFYESKGKIENWTEADRNRFMAGVVDLGALLELPSDATKDDWALAQAGNSDMREFVQSQFGDDIWEKVDAYYAIFDDTQDSRDAANQYLKNNPEVEQAMQLRKQIILSDPTMTAYYGGVDMMEKYHKGTFYQQAQERLGEEIFDIQAEYFALKDRDSRAARSFLNENPVLKEYWDAKAKFEQEILGPALVNLSTHMPEAQYSEIREDLPKELSLGQEQALAGVQQTFAEQQNQQVSPEQLERGLGREAFDQVLDFLYDGEPLDGFAQRRLQDFASRAGITEQEVLELIQQGVAVP